MQLEVLASQIRGLSDEYRWSQTYVSEGILITLEIDSDGSFSGRVEGEKITAGLTDLLKKWQPQDIPTFQRLISQYIDSSLIRSSITSLIVGYLTTDRLFLSCKMGGSALIK